MRSGPKMGSGHQGYTRPQNNHIEMAKACDASTNPLLHYCTCIRDKNKELTDKQKPTVGGTPPNKNATDGTHLEGVSPLRSVPQNRFHSHCSDGVVQRLLPRLELVQAVLRSRLGGGGGRDARPVALLFSTALWRHSMIPQRCNRRYCDPLSVVRTARVTFTAFSRDFSRSAS